MVKECVPSHVCIQARHVCLQVTLNIEHTCIQHVNFDLRVSQVSLFCTHAHTHTHTHTHTPPSLARYLDNIIQNSGEEKYCKIRMTNKAFVERVKEVEGAVLFLEAVGFQQRLFPHEGVCVSVHACVYLCIASLYIPVHPRTCNCE